jgi:polar amino acid transport system substrate-binding protein
MLRADAPKALQDVLLGRPASGPIWRASPARILGDKTFTVASGTFAESWLLDRLNDFQLSAKIVPVESYEDGTLRVLDGTANVFFGERSILVEAAAQSESGSDLIVLERLFTSEPMALALSKNDDDFRLVVDKSLSRQFASKEFRDLYGKWFGAPDEAVQTFFRQNALPE